MSSLAGYQESGFFFPESGFFISGEELNNVSKISWGDVDIGPERLVYYRNTGISGSLPPEVMTDRVNVVSLDGAVAELGEQTILLKEHHRIDTSGTLPRITGYIDQNFVITGKNFYRVTDVIFGDAKSKFTVAGPSRIEARIPKNALHAPVTVFSALRSGEGGAPFNSGDTTDKFIPVPEIVSINPNQALPDTEITISGYSFGAVTGVRFPDKTGAADILSPRELTNETLKVTVPNGSKTRGNFTYFLESGIFSRTVGGDEEGAIVHPTLKPSTEANTFIHLALIDRVKPDEAVVGGNLIYLEGRNFTTGILNLVETGVSKKIKIRLGNRDLNNFEILNKNLIQGILPSDLASGEYLISLYSEIGDLYPSGQTVLISGNLPTVSSVVPNINITGKQSTIRGNDFYNISKATLTRSDITGVFVDITGANGTGIVNSSFGDRIEHVVPTGLTTGGFDFEESGRGSFYVDVSVSGHFGQSQTLKSGFFLQGRPFIENLLGGYDPEVATRAVNSTGSLTGLNLLKNSKINFVHSVNTDIGYGFFKATGVATSGNYARQNFFNFPRQFETTGIRLNVTNFAGESELSKTIPVFQKPVISGFTPESGTVGTRVTVTGYFSGLYTDPSSILPEITGFTFKSTVGATSSPRVSLDSITASSVNELSFTVPSTASESNYLMAITSGGNAFSEKRFDILPKVPTVTKIIPEPKSPLEYSVLGKEDNVELIGDNLHLVQRVVFFDEEGKDIFQQDFISQNTQSIKLGLPTEKQIRYIPGVGNSNHLRVVSSDHSGVFRLLDRYSRNVTGTVNYTGADEFQIAEFTGLSGQYGILGEEISLSGEYFSGLRASFVGAPLQEGENYLNNGDHIDSEFVRTNKFSESGFSIDVKVPRDIVKGRIKVTGNNNDSILETNVEFFPLPTISGVSGWTGNFLMDVGSGITITGINAHNTFESGDLVVGITGSNQLSFFPINSSISLQNGVLSNQANFQEKFASIDFTVGTDFTGSGQMFIMSPWEDYASDNFIFEDSKTKENLNRILTNEFFTVNYAPPAITGIATGNKFNKNISGFISGKNLSPITGLFFSGTGAAVNAGDHSTMAFHSKATSANFVAESNTLIRFEPIFNTPAGLEIITGTGFLVVESSNGSANSMLSGGIIQLVTPLDVDEGSMTQLEGVTGSTFNISGSGMNSVTSVVIKTQDHEGNADFTATADSGMAITIPKFSIAEGQDALVTINGLLTDNYVFDQRYTIIHDAPTVQFNVLSGRSAPEQQSSRSSIFTIVETIDEVDYYVTKMVQPDGQEVIINTIRT